LLVILIPLFILRSLQPYIALILVGVIATYVLFILLLKFKPWLRLAVVVLAFAGLAFFTEHSASVKTKIKTVLFKIAYHQHIQELTSKSGYRLYPFRFIGSHDPRSGFNPYTYPPVFYRHIMPPEELLGTPQATVGDFSRHKIYWGSFFLSYVLGMGYVIFSPFPWAVNTALQLQAYPQTIFMYLLLPFIVMGIFLSVKYKSRDMFPILTFYFIVLSLLALTEGSIGGLFRHRDWVMPITLMFGALGILRLFRPHYALSQEKTQD
jgi:hypothetical protein